MTVVPPHRPRFAVFKCSDARLDLVLGSVLKDGAPGLFFKITNAGTLLPPYFFHVLVQHPLEIVAGGLLKFCSYVRMRVLAGRFGQSEAARRRMDRFVNGVHYSIGWLAISGTYGCFRYAIQNKGARNAILVVHEACGAHEENLGPHGKPYWNRTIKQNAIDNMRKLKGLPISKDVDNWYAWYVSFSKRGIQTFDHSTQTWRAMTVEEIEGILDRKLGVASMSDLFKEIWTDPTTDGFEDSALALAPEVVALPACSCLGDHNHD